LVIPTSHLAHRKYVLTLQQTRNGVLEVSQNWSLTAKSRVFKYRS
jgi:hypothetical protein